jgi:hypothetical protein
VAELICFSSPCADTEVFGTRSVIPRFRRLVVILLTDSFFVVAVESCVDGLAYLHTRVVLLFVFDVVLAPLTVAAAQSKTMTMAHERGRIIIRRQIHRASK